jgi:hypothetical protein
MKRMIQGTLYTIILLVMLTITSNCTINLTDNHPPKHKQRTVWISGVSYRQVYYVQNRNVVIVSQEVIPQKKKHWDNGKHKGH